jgi:GNAT superfamily N-acetyltransferase
MNLQFLDFEADFSAVTRIRNQFAWQDQLTPAEFLQRYRTSPPGRFNQRFAVIQGDTVVGVAGVYERIHSATPGVFTVFVYTDSEFGPQPEVMIQSTLELERLAVQNGASEALTEYKTEIPWMIDAMKEIGYQETMRFPLSGLKPHETDFAEPTLNSDEQIVSYAQYKANHLETWEHDLWRIEMDVAADLPLPFPFKETEFQEFAEDLHDPFLRLEFLYLFLRDGHPVGLSQLYPSSVAPTIAAVGLTGTRREFRRQGIARRLKHYATNRAKEAGIELLITDNEENNPMLDLNLQLGYKVLFENVAMSKPLA